MTMSDALEKLLVLAGANKGAVEIAVGVAILFAHSAVRHDRLEVRHRLSRLGRLLGTALHGAALSAVLILLSTIFEGWAALAQEQLADILQMAGLPLIVVLAVTLAANDLSVLQRLDLAIEEACLRLCANRGSRASLLARLDQQRPGSDLDVPAVVRLLEEHSPSSPWPVRDVELLGRTSGRPLDVLLAATRRVLAIAAALENLQRRRSLSPETRIRARRLAERAVVLAEKARRLVGLPSGSASTPGAPCPWPDLVHRALERDLHVALVELRPSMHELVADAALEAFWTSGGRRRFVEAFGESDGPVARRAWPAVLAALLLGLLAISSVAFTVLLPALGGRPSPRVWVLAAAITFTLVAAAFATAVARGVSRGDPRHPRPVPSGLHRLLAEWVAPVATAALLWTLVFEVVALLDGNPLGTRWPFAIVPVTLALSIAACCDRLEPRSPSHGVVRRRMVDALFTCLGVSFGMVLTLALQRYLHDTLVIENVRVLSGTSAIAAMVIAALSGALVGALLPENYRQSRLVPARDEASGAEARWCDWEDAAERQLTTTPARPCLAS